MNDYQDLYNLITDYQIITIYRHQRPDGDAVGSQLGLKQFILDNFKNKEVYAMGVDTYDRYPIVEQVSDDKVRQSLAIILDTANAERISDERFSMAKEIVKIDHHIIIDQYGKYNYVNPSSAATAQVLVDIFKSDSFKHLTISKEAATYLYSGLLTDTLSFKTSNTTSETLRVASILTESGIDINEINEHLFSVTFEDFQFCTYLRSKMILDGGLAYAILDKEELDKYHITSSKARAFISDLSGVDDFKIWVVFTQNNEGTYDVSLRSKKAFKINEIANKYQGGGHANACGIKGINAFTLKELLKDLKQLISY